MRISRLSNYVMSALVIKRGGCVCMHEPWSDLFGWLLDQVTGRAVLSTMQGVVVMPLLHSSAIIYRSEPEIDP